MQSSLTTRKPNIIFFFTDQQRWDTCGERGSDDDFRTRGVPLERRGGEALAYP